jgi:hypothetical protein
MDVIAIVGNSSTGTCRCTGTGTWCMRGQGLTLGDEECQEENYS